MHKAALYAVLTFVIVGAAISLAGPGRVAAESTASEASTTKEVPVTEQGLLATQSTASVTKAGT